MNQAIIDAIKKHLTERHWENNPPRGLAISIALEANELLEHFQWQDEPVGDKNELAKELADILIYAVQFALVYDINIDDAIMKKLAKAAKKYPVQSFQSSDFTIQRAAWLQAKKKYRKDTTL